MTIVEIATTITATAAAFGVVVYVIKRVTQPVRDWFTKINLAVKELQPNAGGSIKDAVNRIDRRMEETSARTLSIQDSFQIPTYECAPDGSNRYANRALCELFGLESEHMRGNGWLEGIAQEDREMAHEVWHHCVRNNIPYECDYTVVNQRTGERMKCRTYARAMKNSKGEIIGYHGTAVRLDKK